MADVFDSDPAVMLEHTELSRELAGPFLILGLEKDADPEQVEAHWAQRVIWARKGALGSALADVNWAREVLKDVDRRVQADLDSPNPDTAAGVMREATRLFGPANGRSLAWTPRGDNEPSGEFVPATPIPESDEVRRAIVPPRVPAELPGVFSLLRQMLGDPVDPWALDWQPSREPPVNS